MAIFMGKRGIKKAEFEWDPRKNLLNIEKHGVDFYDAQHAFLDKRRVIAEDLDHSHGEKIIGAGYWRKGKKIYDEA